MSLLNTKEGFGILVNFSLIEQIDYAITLLAVRNWSRIKILVHILLAKWNVILEINEKILVEEVIHFVIHSFYYMISNIVTIFRDSLKLTKLHI